MAGSFVGKLLSPFARTGRAERTARHAGARAQHRRAARTAGVASVSVRDLSLNFGGVSVLEHLDLDVADGEFLVLLGPSGCGKSTLLNCIAGLIDVTDGQIFINGWNVTWEEPKDRHIGMVFQSYALYPQMSVRRNLSFGLRSARVAPDEIKQRIARTAEILQIEALLDRKPSQLSGGSASASPSAGRWFATSMSFCSTSLSAISMPSSGRSCVSRSSACTRSWPIRWSTSPTIRSRP